jgi:hypothetical protein
MADYRLNSSSADKIFLKLCNQAIITFLREINLILLALLEMFMALFPARVVWLRTEYDKIKEINKQGCGRNRL